MKKLLEENETQIVNNARCQTPTWTEFHQSI